MLTGAVKSVSCAASKRCSLKTRLADLSAGLKTGKSFALSASVRQGRLANRVFLCASVRPALCLSTRRTLNRVSVSLARVLPSVSVDQRLSAPKRPRRKHSPQATFLPTAGKVPTNNLRVERRGRCAGETSTTPKSNTVLAGQAPFRVLHPSDPSQGGRSLSA